MGPKKKPDKDEGKTDPDVRARGESDRRLEQAEEDVAAKKHEVEEFAQKHEENDRRLKQIKELDNRIPDLEEKQKRAFHRFKRCLIPERPESAAGGRPPGALGGLGVGGGVSVNPAETQALHLLAMESTNIILEVLMAYYRKTRTKKEQLIREQQAGEEEAAQPQRKQSVGGKPPPKAAPPPKKGAVPEDDALLTQPDQELRCPIGIDTSVFEKVLKCRLDRIQYEEELERCRDEVRPLREASLQAKHEGVGKQQVSKGKRQLVALEKLLEECKAKVQQEDDDFRREREVEQWRQNQRAQSAEDGGKRPPSAKKK